MEPLAAFHFLRPWFLVALPLALFLSWRLWQARQQATGLETWINPSLLKFLTQGSHQQPSRLPYVLMALLWCLLFIALSGPTWEQRPQPVFQQDSVVIIVLDLSPSMMAEDIKPSRIVRAHLKVQDFFSTRKDGLSALIVYSGEAFVVTPLTDDGRTITNLLPTLKPGILPIPGSNVEMAIELAKELVTGSGSRRGSVLLITDDVTPAAAKALPSLLPNYIELNILGIGTEAGAPIPYQNGFLEDAQGNMVLAKRDDAVLSQLATRVGGHYLPMQGDNSDIDFFVNKLEEKDINEQQRDRDNRLSDAWYEAGPFLLLFCLPFLALLFRRGWLLSLSCCLLCSGLFAPQSAQASWWQSLWQNNNQQGYEQWQQEEYAKAEKKFTDPNWRASSLYKQGKYDEALQDFKEDESAIGDYNRGNSLAYMQQFDKAIAAYDKALTKDPSLEQARINKEKLEQLKQQQQEQQQQNSDNNEQNQDESSENQQSQNADQNQQQNQEQQNQEQQSQQAQNQQGEEQGEEEQQQSQQQAQQQEEEQEGEEQEAQQAQQQAEQDEQEQNGEESEQQAMALNNPELSEEEQQSLQQWLRKVPDDPSGLLKRKFEYEFNKRQRLYQQGKWELPDNNAHKRY